MTDENDTLDVQLLLTARPANQIVAGLRAFGSQPYLIYVAEPKVDENDEPTGLAVKVEVGGGFAETLEEIVEGLEVLADLLKEAIEEGSEINWSSLAEEDAPEEAVPGFEDV